ncbi:MAG: type I secretion C-terminal target domain-containing protein [Pseudomonadota bacterium]
MAGSSRAETSVANEFSTERLGDIARDPETKIMIDANGRLVLVTSDGQTITVPDADPLVAAFAGTPWQLTQQLEQNREALDRLLTQSSAASSPGDEAAGQTDRDTDPSGEAADAATESTTNNTGDGLVSGRASSSFGSNAVSGSSLSSGPLESRINEVSPLKRETSQFGRDDLKRGEVGSAGQNVTVGTGASIPHLTGLSDEEFGLRNGEKLSHSDNTWFPGFTTGVGGGVDHLWLLGDFEYYRSADDFLSVDDILPDYEDGSPNYGPLLRTDFEFTGVEDIVFTDTLFDPLAFVSVPGIIATMDPDMGTIAINPDGTFIYTPRDGFSGDAVFTFKLTDPRTGEQFVEEVTIAVAAVADPVLISGVAVTPEDTVVNTPVDVKLFDLDGSETIESAIITGVPAGAVLDWNTTLPTSVVLQPDGSYLITGDTKDIQNTLASLTFLPPDDFSGQIILGIDVVTVETNVPPGTTILTERATAHHDYVIDVIPVADIPDVVGDTDGITPEDTAILLNDLAGNLNDLDGSEVLRYEISGVQSGAKLQDAGGTEYPFVVQPDGTKTYTILPAELSAVVFDPPADAFGNFPMTITAIATEQANNDTATNTAPVLVRVTPVADPIDITAPNASVDEDNAVNIGTNIGITFGDPDGSEVLTDVTVSGFPAGAIITYNDIAGVPQTITVPTNGFSISLNGGTEAQIRASLATLNVQPPPHSDVNMPLNVRVTMVDGGVSTLINDADFVVQVAAIADPAALVATPHSGVEDQDIPLPFQVTHPDVDGTEVVETVVITGVPDGFNLIATTTPGATITDNGSGSYTVTGTSDAAINTLLNTLVLDIQPGGNRDDLDTNFSLGVSVTTFEENPTTSTTPGSPDNPGGEVTTARNTQNFTLPVAVRPAIDLPTITGTTSANEDAITNPVNQAVTAAINFGANIAVTDNDKTDGSEVITSIVLGGFPIGAIVTWTDTAGVSQSQTITSLTQTVTLLGGTEDQKRTALSSMSVVPPQHDDADIDVSVTINKSDGTSSEPETAVTGSVTGTHTITVQAIADGPSFTASAAGLEDTNIPLVIASSLIDQDTSETYDFAKVTLPAGITFVTAVPLPDDIQIRSLTVLPGGATEVIFEPGAGTSTAEFEAFLNGGISVRPPLDSDINFNVGIEIGTIESNPTEAGGIALERFARSTNIAVDVTPVVDTWTINSSSTFNEDGIQNPLLAPTAPGNSAPFAIGTALEAGLMPGETAVGDTSETISQVIITGIPDLADLNFATNPNWSIDTSTPGQITITSALPDLNQADAAIRQAIQSLSLDPEHHSDLDIPLGVRVDVVDTDPDDNADTVTRTFNGTHQIIVAAVADAPTGSGSGAGLEDQTIPVSISVSHPDTADESERIKDVVISNVPAGFILTESSTLGATLTNNGGGTYTVSVPGTTTPAVNDAAINDLLAKLALEIDSGNDSREHLDTEFQLSVTATTRETNVNIDGTPPAGEIARLENQVTFSVPITVTAVADPVTHSGQSVLVEDVAKTIGTDISYTKIDLDGTENVTELTVTGFAVGSVVTYTDVGGTPQTLTVTAMTDTITLSGPKTPAGETAIRTALDTLNITPPAQSDVNFSLTISATTTDNDASTNTTTWQHPVIVQAFADAPAIDADNISGNEDTAIPLTIRADRSVDGNTDNSETLSVRLTLPTDSGSPIGTITAIATGAFTVATVGSVSTITGAPTGTVTITDEGNGVYLVEGPGTGNAANDEAAIDAVLTSGVLNLDPRPQFAVTLTGMNGIKVEAISTEAATLVGDETATADDELAPNALDTGDNTTKTETVETFIGVTIAPVIDVPEFNGNSTVLRENNNSNNPSDPDLVFQLGTELGFQLADRDGSQSIDLTLNAIPDTAVVRFGTTVIAKDTTQVINGVTVGVVDNTDGTISVSVAGVVDDSLTNDAIDVLESLNLILQDDNDTDFTVGISGTTTEAISGASAPFSDTHAVTIQAAADRPTISGAGTGNEDEFIEVPVTVTLNDTDGQAQGSGSETLQSVRITGIPFETSGVGEATATPQAQFKIEGVTYDWASNAVIPITNANGSFTVNRATDGRLIFTPATVGNAGDTRAIQSALLTLEIKRGDHVGNDYTLSVRAISVESNPTETNNNGPGVNGDQISRATASQTTNVTVDVVPVTDPITVTSPATITIDEDGVRDENGDGVAGVRLNNLFSSNITQTDRDGSETLTYEVTGLTGGSFSAGSFNAGTNTWSFTAAQYANAVWRPPTHATGTFSGTLTAFTQDQSNGGVAAARLSDSATFSVVVKPDPDRPNASGSSTIYEDQPTGLGNEGNFGADITYSLVDTDGSESITEVVLDTTTLQAGWVVSFNDGSTWTSTNTGGTLPTGVAEAGGVFTITGPNINAAVDAFVVAAPANSDANASVAVSVTTTDTADDTFQGSTNDTDSNGDVDTATRTYAHNIRTLAIADTPDIQAGYIVEGDENDTFGLIGTGGETLQALRSVDTDGVSSSAGWGSEVLSVRITGVPSGVVLSGDGVSGGSSTFTVTAANEDELNARLDAIQVTPGDWSGETTLTITAVTTEQGEGGGGTEIEVETATDIDTITLRVFPEVDVPWITGNAVGDEDTNIKIPLRVDLKDRDGSEIIDHVDISNLPAGATFVNAAGAPLGTETALNSGIWRFTPAEVSQLHIRPPEDYSSPLQGDISLNVQVTVTDTASTGTATSTLPLPPFAIAIEVREVADKPNDFAVAIAAKEDQPIALGQGILSAAGVAVGPNLLTDLNASVLSDNDGSENLSFVISGLPAGVIPSSSAGSVTFLGGGKWSITADAIASLEIPADPNYSGNAPYNGASISVVAVSQEIQGDQAASDPWTVAIEVEPVVNDLASDGLQNWNPSVTVTEAKDTTPGTNVSLANIAVNAGNFTDNDGSEEVLSYTLDLTGLITGAQVLERVRELMVDPTATDTEARDWVIANGIAGGNGLFTDNGNGTITISAELDGAGELTTTAESKLAQLSLLASIFDDSSVNFSIPVSVQVRDRADLSTGPLDVVTTETTTFNVNLAPIADTPTVLAENPDNNGNTADVDTFGFNELISLNLGGDTTDRDAIDLGRTQSETIYYVLGLAGATGGTAPDFVLLDSTNNVIGLNNGDGSWVVTEAELADINLLALPFGGPPVTVDFTLTTVSNDGSSQATNSAGGLFQFIVDPGTGGSAGTPPPAPVINAAALLGQTEDTPGALANATTPFVVPGDGPDADTNPDPVNALTVIFEVPAGVTVSGAATFNPTTGRWVATADDFNNGLFTIRPPSDSSDPIDVQVQAVAIGTNFVTTSTPVQTLTLPVAAVADGPSISATPAAGTEDTPVDLNVSLGLRDTDGSETAGAFAYLKPDNGATILGGYPVVTETVDGVTLSGYYKVPAADLSTIQLQGASNWHGTVTVEVAATSIEQSNNDVAISQSSFTVPVEAAADAPIVSAPSTPVAGTEDTPVDLTGLLSAALADTDATNGAELLSVKIENVPAGTLFSAGSNNGDNSWTIPVAALATLMITTPTNYAGTMTLTLTALSLETSNGDENASSVNFDLVIAPVADVVEVLPQNATVDATGRASLDLDVRMADNRGTLTGEQPPEQVEITFTGVPTGVALETGQGGTVLDNGAGQIVFTGTQTQANDLALAAGPQASSGTSTISIASVRTIDGSSSLDAGFTDTFTLTVPNTISGMNGLDDNLSGTGSADLIFGLSGADTLVGGGGADGVFGGPGLDILTGGVGADTFGWNVGDLDGNVDRITDFTTGPSGDALDISDLLQGFDETTSILSEFVSLTQNGSNTTVAIDVNGGGNSFADAVVLEGVTGADENTLRANGNLIV